MQFLEPLDEIQDSRIRFSAAPALHRCAWIEGCTGLNRARDFVLTQVVC